MIGRGRIQVSLADARVFAADIVGRDPSTDLAVLKMSNPPADVPALEFDDSDALKVGEAVIALGNPLGLSNTVTLGIVSALERPVRSPRVGDASLPGGDVPLVTNAIQTDAAVNPGNSGGALVDAAGQLIGINSATATLGVDNGGPSGSIGLGFAIPSNEARWVAQAHRHRKGRTFLPGVSLENVIVRVNGSAAKPPGSAPSYPVLQQPRPAFVAARRSSL